MEEPIDDGLPLAPPNDGQWIEVVPGGDTICSRGTPYRFFVRGGRPDRVMIDFQGGGACWDALTCGFAGTGALFSQEVVTLATFTSLVQSSLGAGGILSNDPDNPFHDWTIIHIPYCTGDVHWGNARTQYGTSAIEHRGFVNATAALDWAYTRYRNPTNVLVSGCSAGAYGAVLHSAYIARRYASSSIAVFADSGAGIITDSFLNDSLPNWNAEPALPRDFVPGLDRPIIDLSLTDLYIEIGRSFPRLRLAQTQTQYDQDQVFFYTAMGGTAADWPVRMRAGIDEIRAAIPNFTAYVPGGSMHCAGIYPFFVTREVNGVALSEWTESLALGAQVPPPALCEGSGCCEDMVCEECASGPSAWCRFCSSWPESWPECAGP